MNGARVALFLVAVFLPPYNDVLLAQLCLVKRSAVTVDDRQQQSPTGLLLLRIFRCQTQWFVFHEG